VKNAVPASTPRTTARRFPGRDLRAAQARRSVAGLGTRQPVLRRTASIVVVLPTLPAASMARYSIV
jgi:hypothetical protein